MTPIPDTKEYRRDRVIVICMLALYACLLIGMFALIYFGGAVVGRWIMGE